MRNPSMFRTLPYSKPEQYSEPCQASIMQKLFLGTLRNPGIFGTLVYSETEEYSESCQAFMMQQFFPEPCVTLRYLELWYIQNLMNT